MRTREHTHTVKLGQKKALSEQPRRGLNTHGGGANHAHTHTPRGKNNGTERGTNGTEGEET